MILFRPSIKYLVLFHYDCALILDRWSEYIGELYDDDRGEMPVITTGSISPITYQEVEYVLKGMPMRKSPGPDDIVTEMLVAAGDMGIAELTKLSNMMYIHGGFPSELNKSIFITLPKVNGATKCEKHHTDKSYESYHKAGTSNCNQQNKRKNAARSIP